ncbi:hypothetical protein [Thaumasiovibrio sp. DFM-14]|uniref:hypothetical protein n=1 Tax=Thaumasiovibrio sp. DFM-14 TaxID=3384792 RepID=UPI0039A1DF34
MKKRWYAALLLLSGCAKVDYDMSRVNFGDERQVVIEQLGEPGDRQLHGRYEVLQYCTVGGGIGTTRFDMIWFHDGNVVGIEDYELTNARMCERHYRAVDWEQAPGMAQKADKIFEIRDGREESDTELKINVD